MIEGPNDNSNALCKVMHRSLILCKFRSHRRLERLSTLRNSIRKPDPGEPFLRSETLRGVEGEIGPAKYFLWLCSCVSCACVLLAPTNASVTTHLSFDFDRVVSHQEFVNSDILLCFRRHGPNAALTVPAWTAQCNRIDKSNHQASISVVAPPAVLWAFRLNA